MSPDVVNTLGDVERELCKEWDVLMKHPGGFMTFCNQRVYK